MWLIFLVKPWEIRKFIVLNYNILQGFIAMITEDKITENLWKCRRKRKEMR